MILFTATTVLSTGDWLDQSSPEANVLVRTGENNSLFFLAAGTRTKQEGCSDGQFGAHMNFYFAPLIKGRAKRHPDVACREFLMFRAGNLFGKAPASSANPFAEQGTQ